MSQSVSSNVADIFTRRALEEHSADTHCAKSVRVRSYFGPYFPAFGLNTRIQSECEKIQTRIT